MPFRLIHLRSYGSASLPTGQAGSPQVGLRIFLVFFVLFAITPLIAYAELPAPVYSGTIYQIREPVLNSSGNYATSSNFQLQSTALYVSGDRTTSTNYILKSGFTTFPQSATVVAGSGGEPSGGGGGGGSPSLVSPFLEPTTLVFLVQPTQSTATFLDQVSSFLASLFGTQTSIPVETGTGMGAGVGLSGQGESQGSPATNPSMWGEIVTPSREPSFASLMGQVTTNKNGVTEPISGATIILQKPGPAGIYISVTSTKTSANGSYTLSAPAGTYRVLIRAPGYRTKIETFVMSAASATVPPILLEPQPVFPIARTVFLFVASLIMLFIIRAAL